MSADFTPIIPDPPAQPSKGSYTDLSPFRFWCQKVMPLVYDESLSYYEVLCKLVDYLNKTMEDVGVLHDDVDNMFASFQQLTEWTDQQIEAVVSAYSELQSYVNNYFDNLDAQQLINNKLDEMAQSGTLTILIAPLIPTAVSSWLSDHVNPETGYVLDNTLSISNAAADAKAAGDAISNVKDHLKDLYNGIAHFTNLVVGSLNNDGTLNTSAIYAVASNDWVVFDYPVKVSISGDYEYRVYNEIDGSVTISSFTDINNLVFPNIKTKFLIWKPDTYSAIDLQDVVDSFTVQTYDDYITKNSEYAIKKYNAGYDLFDKFLRMGSITNGTYYFYVYYRVATPDIVRYDRDIEITANTDFKFAIHTFDENDDFIEDLGWQTNIKITRDQGFKIIIARTTEDTSEHADVDEFRQAINISSVFVRKNEGVDPAGEASLKNFSVGSLNSDGTLNQGTNYMISSTDWMTFKYPLKVDIKNGYQYRFYNDIDGVISTSSFTDINNVLFPNIKTKFVIWKTNTYTPIDLNDAALSFTVQTPEDYLTSINTQAIKKYDDGYDLFNGFLRKGAVTNGVYYFYVYYRVSTPDIVRYDRDIEIKANSGFRFYLHFFDENNDFVEAIGWFTSYKIKKDQGFKIAIARTVEDTSEQADVDEFRQAINVLSVFVRKDELDNISSLLNQGFIQSGNRPHLAAHQGYHVLYPGNSNPAFIAAGENQYWAIESDINQTADNKFVMIHDTSVDSTTDGTGNVNELTLAEIRELHLTGTELQVPTLEEFLSICKRYSCVPIMELKSTVTASGIIAIVNILKAFGLDKTCILIGSKFNFDNVRAATKIIPYLSIYQYSESFDFESEFAYNAGYDNSGMDCDYTLSLDLVNAADLHNEDMLFGIFTVDTNSGVLNAFENGADFVTTNTVLPIPIE